MVGMMSPVRLGAQVDRGLTICEGVKSHPSSTPGRRIRRVAEGRSTNGIGRPGSRLRAPTEAPANRGEDGPDSDRGRDGNRIVAHLSEPS